MKNERRTLLSWRAKSDGYGMCRSFFFCFLFSFIPLPCNCETSNTNPVQFSPNESLGAWVWVWKHDMYMVKRHQKAPKAAECKNLFSRPLFSKQMFSPLSNRVHSDLVFFFFSPAKMFSPANFSSWVRVCFGKFVFNVNKCDVRTNRVFHRWRFHPHKLMHESRCSEQPHYHSFFFYLLC